MTVWWRGAGQRECNDGWKLGRMEEQEAWRRGRARAPGEDYVEQMADSEMATAC